MQKHTMGLGVGEWEAFLAEPRSGADAQQPSLVPRSGSWARLTASVRPLGRPFVNTSQRETLLDVRLSGWQYGSVQRHLPQEDTHV
jgi:hypothetical protein